MGSHMKQAITGKHAACYSFVRACADVYHDLQMLQTAFEWVLAISAHGKVLKLPHVFMLIMLEPTGPSFEFSMISLIA